MFEVSFNDQLMGKTEHFLRVCPSLFGKTPTQMKTETVKGKDREWVSKDQGQILRSSCSGWRSSNV